MNYKCIKSFQATARMYYYGTEITDTEYSRLTPEQRRNFQSASASYSGYEPPSYTPPTSNYAYPSSTPDFSFGSDSSSSSSSGSDFGGYGGGDFGGGGASSDY